MVKFLCKAIWKKNSELKPIKEIRFKESDLIYEKTSRLHPKKYTTIFGQLELKRYGYQPKDRDNKYDGSDNIYPLDVKANLHKNSYSYVLQEIVSLASNNQSFKQTSKFIEKIFNINLGVDAVERIIQDTSSSFGEFYNELNPIAAKEQEIVIVSADGKGVPMTKEESKNIKGRVGKGEKKQKKKESLVSVCYSTLPISRTATQVASTLIYGEVDKDIEQFKTQDILKVASLAKTKKECFLDIKKYSQKLSSNKIPIVVLDGAKSLWSLTESTFSDTGFIGILDIIHVRDYLYLSAHALHKEGSDKLREWVFKRCEMILEGKVEKVILELESYTKKISKNKSDVLQKTIKYFTNHLKYMRYDQYLKEGYPIASGVVESACSQVVANRTELPGARWTINGAEAILKIRSACSSELWDEYWKYNKASKMKANYSIYLDAVNNVLEEVRMCG